MCFRKSVSALFLKPVISPKCFRVNSFPFQVLRQQSIDAALYINFQHQKKTSKIEDSSPKDTLFVQERVHHVPHTRPFVYKPPQKPTDTPHNAEIPPGHPPSSSTPPIRARRTQETVATERKPAYSHDMPEHLFNYHFLPSFFAPCAPIIALKNGIWPTRSRSVGIRGRLPRNLGLNASEDWLSHPGRRWNTHTYPFIALALFGFFREAGDIRCARANGGTHLFALCDALSSSRNENQECDVIFFNACDKHWELYIMHTFDETWGSLSGLQIWQ